MARHPAVAILAGLLLIFARRRATGALGGWLALIAGAWLILGPTVSLLWERGAGGVGAPLGSPHRQAFELLGYFYGVGVLIIALAAYATGRFVSRPWLGEAPNVISLKGAAAKPSAAARPAEEVTAGAPHDAPHAPAGDAPRRRAVLLSAAAAPVERARLRSRVGRRPWVSPEALRALPHGAKKARVRRLAEGLNQVKFGVSLSLPSRLGEGRRMSRFRPITARVLPARLRT